MHLYLKFKVVFKYNFNSSVANGITFDHVTMQNIHYQVQVNNRNFNFCVLHLIFNQIIHYNINNITPIQLALKFRIISIYNRNIGAVMHLKSK